MTDGDGNRIGARFVNPIFDEDGNRVGSNQGYTYYFPPDDAGFTVGAIEEAQSAYAAVSFPTRTFYFKDGTITLLNEAVVAASGAYEKYYSPRGGTIHEVITNTNPYEAKIWLLEADDAMSAAVGSGIPSRYMLATLCATTSAMMILLDWL